jgi:hypothetical protein
MESYAHGPWAVPTVLLVGLVASTLYAAYLNTLDGRYNPRWTWVTVVIGNALIGLTFAAFCALGILPWLAFQLLFATNVALGAPIIIWQLGFDRARQIMGQKDTDYGTTHQGRPRDHRTDARGSGRD